MANLDQTVHIEQPLKKLIKGLSWESFDNNLRSTAENILNSQSFQETEELAFSEGLKVAISKYRELRQNNSLWKICEGKQILQSIAVKTGFSKQQSLISASFVAWNNGKASLPTELGALRAKIESYYH